MYTLDIETIRQIMLAHKKTGYLCADLPVDAPARREPWRVEIKLEAGNIISCTIANSQGPLFVGEKAYRELVRLGQITWTLVPLSAAVTPPEPVVPITSKSVVPRPRQMNMEPLQTRLWPRMHKLVYGLTNGTRSATEIAELLSTTPEVIEKVLRDLQSIHVIEMEE